MRNDITCKEDLQAYREACRQAASERESLRMEAEADAQPRAEECQECEGTGRVFYSCCGDDIRGNDIDLCPTCHEHCDVEDGEECESCGGTGYITVT